MAKKGQYIYEYPHPAVTADLGHDIHILIALSR